MSNEDKLNTVNKLQTTSQEVYKAASKQFKIGDSEAVIASKVKREFNRRQVTDYWYDVPIIVLIGPNRLLDGSRADYDIKSPSEDIYLEEGSLIYIDMHPQDHQTTLWGDWTTMAVFHPRSDQDKEQLAFLGEIREIHRSGIAQLNPAMTGAEVFNYFLKLYRDKDITPLVAETKQDIGHTIHSGPKLEAHRLFLCAENLNQIGGNYYAIEPGGYRTNKKGNGILAGRFEECVYIPESGLPIILGNESLLSLAI